MRPAITDGDNFEVKNPWRVLEGACWRKWQLAALEACLAAAETNDDEIGAARIRREIRSLRLEP